MGAKGRAATKDVSQLKVANLMECKEECERIGTECHGVEWYPFWSWTGGRIVGDRDVNCVLQKNHKNNELITKSTGLSPGGKKGPKHQMDAVECHGKKEGLYAETTTTTTTADPWLHVGDGHCRMGKKGRMATKSTLELKVANVTRCKAECENTGVECHGIEWYPHWDLPSSNWGAFNLEDREVNCVLQQNHKNDELITKSTGRSGKKGPRFKVNAVECYGKKQALYAQAVDDGAGDNNRTEDPEVGSGNGVLSVVASITVIDISSAAAVVVGSSASTAQAGTIAAVAIATVVALALVMIGLVVKFNPPLSPPAKPAGGAAPAVPSNNNEGTIGLVWDDAMEAETVV